MDLIEKIENAIYNSDIKSPILELTYDNKGNVFGYISSKSFTEINNQQSQRLIWKALKNRIDKKDLLNIIMIIPETPIENLSRLKKYYPEERDVFDYSNTNYFYHITPKNSRYWAFIDVSKSNNTYRSCYITLNSKEKFSKGLKYNYPLQVAKFLEINEENFYFKLMNEIYDNVKTEITADIMLKYEELSSNGNFGYNNIYNYIFYNFNLIPTNISNLIFTKEEILLLKNLIKDIDGFKIQKSLSKAIEISTNINESKTEF